ncbi:MAG: hypothetical protein ABI914_03150, partial [Acidobacteriota bacterium]
MTPSLLARCEGWFWDHSVRPRAAARALIGRATLLRRLLSTRGGRRRVASPLLVFEANLTAASPFADPTVTVFPGHDVSGAQLEAFLARQTAVSGSSASAGATAGFPGPSFCYAAAEDLDGAPDVEIEAL